ncbi:MAG: hypothetical protein KDF65_06575, partial [Anaerolineae bacterium]|nr:hypothetical protein [Anaerolineae bacterium]
ITIPIPPQLLGLGLTESQLAERVLSWLVIDRFQARQLTASEAGHLLGTDRDGFLSLLDELGLIYETVRENRHDLPRVSPPLADLAQAKSEIAVLESELADARLEIFQAEQNLRDADRLKSEFIATVSHELRTPLNSILGFAKLLLNQKVGPLTELQFTDLSIIYDSAKQLQALVNDILDFSTIDAGKIRLEKSWVSIEEIVVGVMPITMLLLENKPIDLREEIEPHLPYLYVDRGRIRQVVLNLLSNAAKFTDKGSICLKVYRLVEEEPAQICFSVIDTGIGIAEEDRDKVFEAFRQVDSTVGRRAEGTGLGMPISQRLVELHGGQLWFESKVGQGSTFCFTVPVEPVPALSPDNSQEEGTG